MIVAHPSHTHFLLLMTLSFRPFFWRQAEVIKVSVVYWKVAQSLSRHYPGGVRSGENEFLYILCS